MKNIKLSQYVDEQEVKWALAGEDICKQLIDKLNIKLGLDLYKQHNISNPKELFNSIKIWLLSNNQKELVCALKEMGIKAESFYLEIIESFILTITREKDSMYFIRDVLIRSGIITSVSMDENNTFTIESPYVEEPIKFKKATQTFKDKDIQEFIQKKDIKSGCHESALFLIKKYNDFTAVTAVCTKNLGQPYYHSFALDNIGNVVDLTGNLVISKDIYYMLNDVKVISKLTFENYIKVNDESKSYDESSTLMDLLRIAIYNKMKK